MNEPFFSSELPPLENKGPDYGTDIDLLNDETFGSGAVDDDWEGEHNQFAEQHSRNGSVGGVGKPLDDDELELSNQQLAAAVEELVLNSDLDQDSIDPAIVSLRKESRRGYYDPRPGEILMSPYMGEKVGFRRSSSPYSSQSSSSSSVFQTDGMRNIWSSTDAETHDSIGKLPSKVLERQLLNEKLKNMMKNSEPPREFQDEAILSAVKAAPVPCGNWTPMNRSEEMLRQMFPTKPAMLRAEDLEKEFSKSNLRSPSPTFGISIPRDNEANHNALDRSLPARSVSPVIGSPTSHVLPIGTPPKHVTDMLHQSQKQGVGMVMHHLGHPTVPMQGLPQGFMMHPPGKMGPPGLWPPGVLNRPPMNPLLAQELANKMGMNKPLPMIVGSPPIGVNMSPMGSPRFVQAQRHMLRQPMPGFGPRVIRAGPVPIGFRGPMPPNMRQFSNQRFGGPPRPPMYLGPGHLHPEHSRFVRMRRQQQQIGRNRTYNGNYHHQQRTHNHDGSLRDPHSHLMTSRDKEWVVKIQMMALQSDRPEIDDYYYQHFIEKRLREGRLSLDDEKSEQRRLITPTKTNPDHKKYVPVQFDNSLGKLTVSSVYNPRQIIDVIHAEKEDSSIPMDAVDAKMSMNKRLEIYSIIERTYPPLMEMEEIRFQAEGDENEAKGGYLHVIEEFLFPNDSVEIISQTLRIRKGKRLICRVLPHLTQKYALSVVVTLLKQLPVLIKRDQKEDILQEFYFPICQVMKDLDSNLLLEVCSALLPSLNVICKDKFGFSIMCKLLVTVDKNEEARKTPPKKRKTWELYVRGCFKAILAAFGGQKKASVPTQLESQLDTEVMAVLENHSELVSEDGSDQLDRMKDLLSRQKDLDSIPS